MLILSEDLSVEAMTASADYWLNELAETDNRSKQILPPTVHSVVAALKAVERGRFPANFSPKVRLRTRSGKWLLLHASRLMNSTGKDQISVIFEEPQPAEMSPLIMAAYDLTRREQQITQSVLLGWSTAEISARLHISPGTVQDHLKAIFEKTDVNSRGELAGRIFTRQFQARSNTGAPVLPNGRIKG